MADILQEILAQKGAEVAQRKRRVDLSALRDTVALEAPPRDFVGAIRAKMA
ncbi:MAG: indole-3-glycerol-phosphate synthase, partial [Acidithiobacillus ferrivorans]